MGPLEYAARLDRFQVLVMSDEASEDLLQHLGQKAKEDVVEGVKPDMGPDSRMSNWPRRGGDERPLGARYDLLSKTEMAVKPDRYSAGPFKMLEDGRNPRRVGQFASKGRGRGKGGAYTRLRLVTRTVGPMAPKRTWSDAEEVVRREYPPRMRKWVAGRINQARRG